MSQIDAPTDLDQVLSDVVRSTLSRLYPETPNDPIAVATVARAVQDAGYVRAEADAPQPRDAEPGYCPICGDSLRDLGPDHAHRDAPQPRDDLRALTGELVHRLWRDGMLAQDREVPANRMSWDALSEQDRALDHDIAAGIRAFAGKDIDPTIPLVLRAQPSATPDLDALRPWLRHHVACNCKTDDPPDTERCKCGLRTAMLANR